MTGFRTTVWSRLGEAAAGRNTALDTFVVAYRPPVLAFLRGRGLSAEEAEDVTQEVFLRLLDRGLLARGDAAKGRFRSYLIGITLRVLSEWRRHEGALKRGGAHGHISLEQAPDPAVTTEFESLWLRELVQRALAEVERANADHHRLLLLAGEGRTPAEIAARTGRSEGATRTALHRARKRLATAVRAEVAAYCSSQEEYEAELQTFARFLDA